MNKNMNKINQVAERKPELFMIFLSVAIIFEIIIGFWFLEAKDIFGPIVPKAQSQYAGQLWLEPAESVIRAGQDFNLKIMINADGQLVNGVDVVLNYDPGFLSVEDQVIPTSLFPLYPRKFIEKEKGQIIITGAQIQKAEKEMLGDQAFASLKFKALRKGKTEISLATSFKGNTSQGSMIIISGSSRNILGEINNTQIEIK